MSKNFTDLSNEAKNLWAKKRTDDGQKRWLPLLIHLLDTKNTSNWLFNHWLSDGSKKLLLEIGNETEIQQLVKLIGFIHDIGKATPAFQVKRSYDGGHDLDLELDERLVRSGFVNLNDENVISKLANKSFHAKQGEALLEQFGVPASMGALIGGHHGKPLDREPYSDINDNTSTYFQADVPNSNEHEKEQHRWKLVQKEIFDYGLAESGYKSVTEIPEINQPQAVILEGLLIMSDWLSSSEYLDNDYHKPMFTLYPLETDVYDLNLDNRFENAMDEWRGDNGWIPDKLDIHQDQYQKNWNFTARPLQKQITDTIDEAKDPGIVIIEAPMGVGKTEIALVATEQLAYKQGKTGLFFGLPTQATSNAMFDRVVAWLKCLPGRDNRNLSLKLMHGKRNFNKKYTKLPVANEVDSSDGVAVNIWFNGKKSILDEFSVGTIDNLLLMALKQKHLALKHLGLSQKVVVIDEVHAYDTYMDEYLFRALEWLGAYHVPIVILSATLPKSKRVALLDSYYQGKFGKRINDQQQVPEWRNSEAYPLLTMLDGNKIQQKCDFNISKQQSVEVIRATDDVDSMLKMINQDLCSGGIAGVIVNTVRRAQEIAKLALQNYADNEVFLLHSAFLAPERQKLEEQLESSIGKHAKRPAKLIVIGTQVLEQSLDIDFDVLYTDIAPMDLVLQRTGRMHRHDIKRPERLLQPELVVMGVPDADGSYGSANESIYCRYLLQKTDYYLPKKICLPNDISKLVQLVYDENLEPPLEKLQVAKDDFHKQIDKEIGKAKKFILAKPKNNESIHGWLKDPMDNDQQGEAAVRDIQETIEVILIQEDEQGYRLVNGKSLDKCSPEEVAAQVIRLPNVFSYHIDKLIKKLEAETYQHFPDWQNNWWLRGSLCLLLDKDLTVDLEDYKLSYKPKLGLSYEQRSSK